MKKFLLMFIAVFFAAVCAAGCSPSGDKTLSGDKPCEIPTANSQDDMALENVSEAEVILEENEAPAEFSDEFSIHFEGKEVDLFNWDNEIELSELLGAPLAEKTEQLGPGADTFTGSFIRELTYDGLELKLFSPRENGTDFYIIMMKLTENRYLTKRGIKVGDNLEFLQETYPEISQVPDGKDDPQNGTYRFYEGDNPYTFIDFAVADGRITEINVVHEFP